MTRRLLRKPIAHFLLAGVALYLISAWWYGRGEDGEAKPDGPPIVVTRARLAQIRDEFGRHYGSAPSPAEMATLVDAEIEAEVLYREGLARGLDRGDAAIRWRLLQKMRFVGDGNGSGNDDALLSEAKELGMDRDDVVIRRILAEKMRLQASAAARVEAPDEAATRAYLEQHRDLFTTAPRVRFRHVFLSRELRGPATESDAEKLLTELRAGDAPVGSATAPPVPAATSQPTAAVPFAMQARQQGSGDAFPVGGQFEGSRAQVEKVFGADFAARVLELEPSHWSGPIASPYGLHLVRVEAREPARAPQLADVRALVERRIVAERVEAELAKLVRRLRADYDVRIEPEDGTAPQSRARSPLRAVS